MGRRPSEDKVSLYVRKPSNEASSKSTEDTSSTVKTREKKDGGDVKKNKFLQDMARRSLEVPTDFLDKIDDEKKAEKAREEESASKKYPLNRTTTPNSLREHLKETLVKNIGSSTDLAETIHAITDDEILDTFNIDSENIETPPIQRRAFRHKSMRLPNQEEDAESELGSDFSGRRKNHKFRSLTGEGKPLGDRELIIKKKKESNTDLSEGRRTTTDLEDDLGSGLFDRFSTARKTIGRNSIRRKKDEEEQNNNDLEADKKLKGDNWRSKIANKFRKSSDSYDLMEAEKGQELRDYLGQVTPKTEPVRRKPMNIEGSGSVTSRPRTSTTSSVAKDRKSSRIQPGDYDSTLVDGKYVTSVPIINVEEVGGAPGSGNIRPGHSLRDLKKPDTNRRSSIIDRLSRPTRDPPTKAESKVFDRLAGGGKSGSRTSLNSSRPSLDTRGSTSSLASRNISSRATSLPPDKPKGTFNRIRDLSKDITKNLMKNKEENMSNGVVKPRNSNTAFSGRTERKPMSSINGSSNNNINSSSRSLNRSTLGSRTESPKSTRRSTPTINKSSRPSATSTQNSNSTNSFRNGVRSNITKTNPSTTNGRATSSKENLSRSSSSASRSSVTNSANTSRNGSLRTSVVAAASTPSARPTTASRPGNNTVPRTTAAARRAPGASFMKPTAASAKKVLAQSSSTDSPATGRKAPAVTGSTVKMSTLSASSRVAPITAKPSRR